MTNNEEGLDLIPAKVLGERDYGDKDKVKIIIPSRCTPEQFEKEDEDATQMAVVACNNKLGKDSWVWVSYLDDAKTQPVIIRVFWGKTEYDTMNFGGGNPNNTNSNQLACGISLDELAVDVVASAERNYKWSSLNKRIEEEAYAQENPDNKNRALGIRQWNGSRAKSVLNYVYKQDPEQSKKIAGKYDSQVKAYDGVKNISKEVSSRISKILSTSYGKEAQRTCARTGKGDSGYGLSKLIDYGIKRGIKNNASLLLFCDLCNGYGTKAQWDLMAKYGKGDTSFKQFYEDLKSKNPKVPGVYGPMDSSPYNYKYRRKLVYHNIKMMEDAGWLEGSAGNLTNVSNSSNENSKTGWGYPISDNNGDFKVTGKWKTSNGIKLNHKSNKADGKDAIAMYKGKVKSVDKSNSSINVNIEFRTKTDAKHYVEYVGLKSSSLTKGESVTKGATVGKLSSSGLIIRVHKTKNKGSDYVNPTDYIGDNSVESVGGGKYRQKIIQVAKSKKGSKYVFGSKGPDTFDCSGFIYWCFKKATGKTIGGDSRSQPGTLRALKHTKKGVRIKELSKNTSTKKLQKGDIVYFSSGGTNCHVEFYWGNGKTYGAHNESTPLGPGSLNNGYQISSIFRIVN